MKPKTATCRKAVWLCQECGEDHNWESKPNRTMCHCSADAFLSDDGESYNCAGCGQFTENCKCGSKPEKPEYTAGQYEGIPDHENPYKIQEAKELLAKASKPEKPHITGLSIAECECKTCKAARSKPEKPKKKSKYCEFETSWGKVRFKRRK